MGKLQEKSPVVLQVLPELETGGVEVGTVEIATELQKQGIKNFVASQGGRMVHELDKIKVGHLTRRLRPKIFSRCGTTPKNWNALQMKTASYCPCPVTRPGVERLLGRQESRPVHFIPTFTGHTAWAPGESKKPTTKS